MPRPFLWFSPNGFSWRCAYLRHDVAFGTDICNVKIDRFLHFTSKRQLFTHRKGANKFEMYYIMGERGKYYQL